MVKLHSIQIDRVELTKKLATIRVVLFILKRQLKTSFTCDNSFLTMNFVTLRVFLVGAFINKRARLLQSLVFF